MANSSSSTTWLRGCPYTQKAPLNIAHMTHRDVILLVDPDIHLLNFVAERPPPLALMYTSGHSPRKISMRQVSRVERTAPT
jgi:hypothetical protein